MKLSTRSSRDEVIDFLQDVKSTIQSKEFDMRNDITIVVSKKKNGKEKFSTPFTMQELNYNKEEVVECLKELTVKEYSETLIDKDDLKVPKLFVFGKMIGRKLVYIKFKLKELEKKHIICVSFHYAEHDMIFPYA